MGASCQPTTQTPAPAQNTTGAGTEEAATNTPRAANNEVSIEGFAFSQDTITVSPGDTVTWINNDNTPHTVTADDNSFDSGTLTRGDTFSRVFTEPGTYTYHCEPHPNMTGTVIVR